MTRKSTRAVPPAWRSMAQMVGDDSWTVNLGPYSPFVADPAKAPPLTLADRYTATATGQPPAVLTLTVTDRETGATARQHRDQAVVLTIPSVMLEPDAARLLRDARTIIGIARRQTGGPPTGTGLQPSHVIAATIRLWSPDPPPDGTPPTQPEVAHELGTDEEGRTIRRIGETLPGPGKPWERVLREARIAMRQDSVRLVSSRSGSSDVDDAGDGYSDEPTPMVPGHADPSADEPGRPPITRRG